MPQLSYIITARNAEHTLAQTIQSVLAQTEPDVEALIVDDGSTDATNRAAAARRGPRVRLIAQDHAGPAHARNAGWRAALAPRVCFLDAGDTADPAHAQTMLDAIGAADAALCGHEFLGPNLEDLGWQVPARESDTGLSRLIESNRTPLGAFVLDTESLARSLGEEPRFDDSLPGVEDWDLWLRHTTSGGTWAAPVPDPLFRHRLSPHTPHTTPPDTARLWRTGLSMLEAFVDRDGAQGARSWSTQCMASAIAAGQPEVVREIRAWLGGLAPSDILGLVGKTRWALGKRDCAGPATWDTRMPTWQAQLREALTDEPLTTEIVASLATTPHHWRNAA